MFYRRLRKKGTQEDQLKKAKKRVITTTAISRGIAGLSVEDLKAKKNESSDKRKAVRDATLRCVLFLHACHETFSCVFSFILCACECQVC
jgi:hypothetical protein